MRFWHDPWYGDEPLKDVFPHCCDLAEDKWGVVKAYMIRCRVLCSWNIQPRRNLNEWEIGEMGRLMNVLEKYELRDAERQDELVWKLDEKNGFSVRSMYLALCS